MLLIKVSECGGIYTCVCIYICVIGVGVSVSREGVSQ